MTLAMTLAMALALAMAMAMALAMVMVMANMTTKVRILDLVLNNITKVKNMNDIIEINGEKYSKISASNYAIIRCKNAGVHAGHVDSRKDGVLVLRDSRRLWRWWSNFSLSELAQTGVKKGKESECKFACVLPMLVLTDVDVCEVIPCTKEAKLSIESIKNA